MAVIKKNLKDYVPGQNDFLHFATVMNNNAALDLRGTQRLQDSKLLPVQNPIDTNNADDALTPKPNNIAAPVIETNSAGEAINKDDSETDASSGLNTDSESVITEEAVTSTDAPSWEKYKTDNGVLGEADWYVSQGLDPERDYQNTVNTLNYEYQTSMATYGQNAENLYQMGLQNSGVSDIFQANAFSSYLANMNNAANARIAAKKQNKALYGAYVAQKQGDYNTYVQNWQTTVNDAVTAIMQSGVLTSENTDEEIRVALEAYGVTNASNELVAQVKTKLKNIEDLEGSVNKNLTTERIETIDQDLIEATNNGERPNTYAEYAEAENALDALEAEGYDKATIDDQKEVYRKARADLITNVSKGTNKDIDNAYKTLGQEFLGVSEEEWKNMSDGDQRHYIVEKAGELVGTKGGLTREEYGQIVSDWVDIETKSMIKANNESKDNNAFIRAGSLVFELEELYGEGYFTEEQYKNKMNQIVSNIGFEFKHGDTYSQIVWSKTVKEKDFSYLNIQVTPDVQNDKVSNDIVNILNEKLAEDNGEGKDFVTYAISGNRYHLVVLDGKIYGARGMNNGYATWYEIGYQDITVNDSGWGNRTTTDNQKRGMYQLLVTMLENNEASNTPNNSNNEQE